jgi:hypothetical protein
MLVRNVIYISYPNKQILSGVKYIIDTPTLNMYYNIFVENLSNYKNNLTITSYLEKNKTYDYTHLLKSNATDTINVLSPSTIVCCEPLLISIFPSTIVFNAPPKVVNKQFFYSFVNIEKNKTFNIFIENISKEYVNCTIKYNYHLETSFSIDSMQTFTQEIINPMSIICSDKCKVSIM